MIMQMIGWIWRSKISGYKDDKGEKIEAKGNVYKIQIDQLHHW